MKNVHPKLKKGVIPHIFTCQKQKGVEAARKADLKRHRKRLIEDADDQTSTTTKTMEEPIPCTSKGFSTTVEDMEFRESERVGYRLKKYVKIV